MTIETKTILVLIALPEEHIVFQSVFPVAGDQSTGTQVRLEHVTDIQGVRLISVLAEQLGAQSALFSADDAIKDFDPDLIMVLGIAGGVSTDLMIGDVCVSNEIIDVLQNAKVLDASGALDLALAPDFYSIDAELVSSFTFLKVHPELSPAYENWRRCGEKSTEAVSLTEAVRAGGPDLLIGPIACGPVVSSEKFNAKLKALHRKVSAVETESGGVFGRLSRTHIPAIAIRGISDLADADKADLEKRSKGGARRLAMLNACRLLEVQIANVRFINVATRHRRSRESVTGELFPKQEPLHNIIAELDQEIRAKLEERSPEFRTKPESFYLPIPRARKINYADELSGRDLGSPESLVDCLRTDRHIVIRLPRSYPSQALGWSLAHALIRQQISEKVVLPYVITGEAINPPRTGF